VSAVRATSSSAAVAVAGPGFRQVQGPVDKRVPRPGGIRQIHRDLRVLDPAGGWGVLALHADGVGAFLQVSGLIDDQDRVLAAEAIADIVTQVVAHRIGIPH
jgi:hypothetical protein